MCQNEIYKIHGRAETFFDQQTHRKAKRFDWTELYTHTRLRVTTIVTSS